MDPTGTELTFIYKN